jgi:hypothetical protein
MTAVGWDDFATFDNEPTASCGAPGLKDSSFVGLVSSFLVKLIFLGRRRLQIFENSFLGHP